MTKFLRFTQSIKIIKLLVKKNGSIKLNFMGSSMLPTIQPGASLHIMYCNNFETGNIYVYTDKDHNSSYKLVCHRLVDIKGSLYYFKGDNRDRVDEPVDKENIIGEVVSWI